MKVMKNRVSIVLLAILVITTSCGQGNESVDRSGITIGDDDASIFARASQQYFRGSLSSSRENFNSLIYRFPDSPLNHDAQLAVRKIDFELSGNPDLSVPVNQNHVESAPFPDVALVSSPAVSASVIQLETLLISAGASPVIVEDYGAPDVTLVLYPEGYLLQADIVSNSLSSWLSSHTSVPVQPGGDIISTIAPHHQGVVIVIGTDAVVNASFLQDI